MIPAPVHINWNLSYACNFNCAHCYSRSRVQLPELGHDERLTIADNIVASKVLSVNIGGGEPLVCPDIMDVIERLAAGKVTVEVATSGWNVDDATAQRLKCAGLSFAYVSIDHADVGPHDRLRRHSGSHTAAIAAMDSFARAGIAPIASTVVTSDNFDTLESIIELARVHRCVGIELKRLRLQGNALDEPQLQLSREQEAELMAAVPRWKTRYPELAISFIYGETATSGVDEGCPCGKTSLGIMADGSITPCVYNPVSIGNTLEDSITRIWNESPELAWMRAHHTCIASRKDFSFEL